MNIKIGHWYIKTNGMRPVCLVGYHPMKQFLAITSGEDDIRWIPLAQFLCSYEPLKGS